MRLLTQEAFFGLSAEFSEAADIFPHVRETNVVMYFVQDTRG